ncbi:MAG: hypothetical protein MUE85_03915 [Microscillaceae bacterium]|jgi:hypothetical protein|nr:hypothetical protein [Microscillaceae bacterium]
MFENTKAQMNKAYDLANDLVRERLKHEDVENVQILDEIRDHDIIVVGGTYDHIHLVLTAMKIPFVHISQTQLLQVDLRPSQTVFVNCASGFPAEGARKLATFVSAGGQLITTDWALRNVLEVAFPNTVAYNNRPTADEVVRIEVMDRTDPIISGFLDEKVDPVWWLEGSSYPIQILDKEKVKTLIRSKELKEKYGEEAVIVSFEYGKGIVYHMISHFYLQRTETRDKKQVANAGEYFKDKKASAETIKKAEESGVNYAEVQSANTSADFVTRVIISQKRRSKENEKKDKKGN